MQIWHDQWISRPQKLSWGTFQSNLRKKFPSVVTKSVICRKIQLLRKALLRKAETFCYKKQSSQRVAHLQVWITKILHSDSSYTPKRDGFMYKLFLTPRSWVEAKKRCERDGAILSDQKPANYDIIKSFKKMIWLGNILLSINFE